VHVVGTAGHIDHGKSALVQRLTGIDPDRFAEEKERGLTIDLGFAWLTLPSGHEIGFIDVPGHERFIKNMLAGAGGISICLFVVAANEGWKPQSSEHLAILDILGVSAGVIVLTKSDTVDAARLAEARSEVSTRVAETSLRSFPIVACSSVTGDGIAELITELDRVVTAAPPIADTGTPRLWVDRVFTIAGAGTVVTGTLTGGSLAVGDTVEIAPEGRVARIRSIQSHKREIETIEPGNRTALNLAGLERQGAARGDAIVRPGMVRNTRLVDVELVAAASDRSSSGIVEKGAHLLYVGSAEVPVRVKLLGIDSIKPGDAGVAQLTLQDPLPLLAGDRFVLRDAGRMATLGGGRVLDPLPTPTRGSDVARAEMLRSIVSDPSGRIETLVEHYGTLDSNDALYRTGADAVPQGIATAGDWLLSRAEAARRAEEDRATETRLDAASTELVGRLHDAGLAPPLTKELGSDPSLVQRLAAGGQLVRIGDFHISAARAEEVRTKVRTAIAERGPLTVAQIKDLLGTTRKYAVPLCEWLDATGVTVREGDARRLGPKA
jgi:selenocysteine-specific elongation factor